MLDSRYVRPRPQMRARFLNWTRGTAALTGAGITAVGLAPIVHAEDAVTYEVFSAFVPVVAGIEYRDVSGKRLLQEVALPWRITVPVADAFSPEGSGAEVRADWRPNFRTAATVGRVLQGQLVTVRISLRGQTICESTLDLGNATCYGSVPYSPRTDSSYDRSPLFPEPASGLLPGEVPGQRIDEQERAGR